VTTAIIGVGNIGKALARHLVNGGEPVVLAASTVPDAAASELGKLASATTVTAAIEQAEVVVLAVWLDVIKQLISEHRSRLEGKVVIDPSNPVAADAQGHFTRTLPDGVSAGSVVAALVPRSTRYVKAFGSVSAGSLASGANRTPKGPDPAAGRHSPMR
jgi:8-hydroxy-5-deazaflavin:NADPH oxidoreductase